MKIAQLPQRKRKQNIILLILMFGLPLILFAAYQVVQIVTKASADTDPKNVVISNLTTNMITVSWTTDSKTYGSLIPLENGKEKSEVKDKRGTDNRNTHYIELEDLEPNTQYKFKIKSNSTKYTSSEGKELTFTTAPFTATQPSPNPATGSLPSVTNDDVLIYILLSDKTSFPVSATLEDGNNKNWIVDLSALLKIEDRTTVQVSESTGLTILATDGKGNGGIMTGTYSSLFDSNGTLKETNKLELKEATDIFPSIPDAAKLTIENENPNTDDCEKTKDNEEDEVQPGDECADPDGCFCGPAGSTRGTADCGNICKLKDPVVNDVCDDSEESDGDETDLIRFGVNCNDYDGCNCPENSKSSVVNCGVKCFEEDPDTDPEFTNREYRIIHQLQWQELVETETVTTTTGPASVKMTNLTEGKFTVLWISEKKEKGYVKYGTSSSALDSTAQNDGDDVLSPTGIYFVHSVTIDRLQPETTYYFEIVSGEDTYNNNENKYSITTLAAVEVPGSSVSIAGDITNMPTHKEVVVIGKIKDMDETGTSGTSYEVSEIVDEGGSWTMSVADMRFEGDNKYFEYTDDDVLILKPYTTVESEEQEESMEGIGDKLDIELTLGTTDTTNTTTTVSRLSNYGITNDPKAVVNSGTNKIPDTGIFDSFVGTLMIALSVSLSGILLALLSRKRSGKGEKMTKNL